MVTVVAFRAGTLDGRIRWLDYHFERLERGCRRLAIEAPDRAAPQNRALEIVVDSTTSIVSVACSSMAIARRSSTP